MAKYTITNQKELRRSFWEFCKEFGGEFEREANKKKHSFKLDFNIAFGEYKDGLCRWHYIAKFIRTCNTLLIISYVLFNAAFIRCRGVYLRHRSQKIKRLHK